MNYKSKLKDDEVDCLRVLLECTKFDSLGEVMSKERFDTHMAIVNKVEEARRVN